MKNQQINYFQILNHQSLQGDKVIKSNKMITQIENCLCRCQNIDVDSISMKLKQILIVLQQDIESKNRQVQNFKRIKQQQIASDKRTIEQLKVINLSLKSYNQSLLKQVIRLKHKNQLKIIQGCASKIINNSKQRISSKIPSKNSQKFINRRNGYITNKNSYKSVELEQNQPNSSELIIKDSQAKIIIDRYVSQLRPAGKIQKNSSCVEKRHCQHSRSQSSTNVNSIPIPSSISSLKKIRINQSQKYLETHKKIKTYKNLYLQSLFYKPYIIGLKGEKKYNQKAIISPVIKKQTPHQQQETTNRNQHKFINLRDCQNYSFERSLF